MTRIPVGIIGATGTVGQRFVALLDRHPWFEVVAVGASAQSAGRPYGDVVRWREPTPLPPSIAGLIVQPAGPPLGEARIVFSAIDADAALEVEQDFARAGAIVITNTRVHRMQPDVPLVIPEVNAGHIALVERQRRERGWPGAILANPNCSTAALALTLAPLHTAFGLEQVFVTTLQAASGAGYPGVPSLDLLGNVIPFIGGEEEKIESETLKLLGVLERHEVKPAAIAISAHCNRVPVVDGHLEVVSAGFARRPTVEQAIAVLREFRGAGVVPSLPSSPAQPIVVDLRPDRPQTRLDILQGHGMSVTVGRVRPCPVLQLRLVLLGHNTVRGAAGASVQIAELLRAENWFDD